MKTLVALVLGLAFMGRARGKTFALANEAAAAPPGPASAMSAGFWKKKTAEAIGKPELGDGSDEDLLNAHGAHMKIANDMTDDPDPGMENEKKKPVVEPTEEEKRLANEAKTRKADVDLQLANAITAGKITPAEKPAWETKFAADFDATKAELANVEVKLKVAPKTTDLGKRNGEGRQALANEQSRATEVQSLINEKMKGGITYDQAFAQIQREKPALFQAMTQPAAKK